MAKTEVLLPFPEFAINAIKALRNLEKGKGLHTVFSGFMGAAKEYYDTDSAGIVQMLKDAEKKGKIEMHFAKGGSMIYIPGEMPERTAASNDKTLAAILGNGKNKK